MSFLTNNATIATHAWPDYIVEVEARSDVFLVQTTTFFWRNASVRHGTPYCNLFIFTTFKHFHVFQNKTTATMAMNSMLLAQLMQDLQVGNKSASSIDCECVGGVGEEGAEGGRTHSVVVL
jgi:hypothetical protein